MGRGALVFKGDVRKAHKKKKKSKHEREDRGEEKVKHDEQSEPVLATAKQLAANTTAARPLDPPKIQKKLGTGHITTSGTVVTGHGTKFEKELSNGDAMVVTMANGGEEMRIIKMRLGPVSCAISSEFSANLSTPTAYHIISKPRNVQRDASAASQQAALDQKEEEEKAFGTYGTTNELVYRETTEHGSYRIKRVKVAGQTTRGDLLSMRTKKKSDKYC